VADEEGGDKKGERALDLRNLIAHRLRYPEDPKLAAKDAHPVFEVCTTTCGCSDADGALDTAPGL
jgi:hypothetical protein